jgi:hypothetical protein
MTKLVNNFDNTTVLSEKFAAALLQHDYANLEYWQVSGYQKVTNRETTLQRLTVHVKEFLQSLNPFVDPQKGISLFVIGRPKDYYLYYGWPFHMAVSHYIAANKVSMIEYFQDSSIQVFRLTGNFFRASEVYMISPTGQCEELTKEGELYAYQKFPESPVNRK